MLPLADTPIRKIEACVDRVLESTKRTLYPYIYVRFLIQSKGAIYETGAIKTNDKDVVEHWFQSAVKLSDNREAVMERFYIALSKIETMGDRQGQWIKLKKIEVVAFANYDENVRISPDAL